MDIKIYELKADKYFEFVFAICILTIGVVSILNEGYYLGISFLFIGCTGVLWMIMNRRQEPFCIQLNKEGIIIPYRETGFSIKWSEAVYSWKEIKSVKVKEGFPRNGYVPIFLICMFQNGGTRKFLLPTLQIEFSTLEQLINKNIQEHINSY